MPKFKVCVQRYVEETAAFEIEASTPEAAAELGEIFAKNNDNLAWGAGDDIINDGELGGVYAVLDAAGDAVWER